MLPVFPPILYRLCSCGGERDMTRRVARTVTLATVTVAH